MSTPPRGGYLFGLIGWPVAHSLSPRLHQAAFQAIGLRGEYHLFPVDPDTADPSLDILLAKLRSGEIHGLNVTVPYKEHLLSRVDHLSAGALAIGAVNTLFVQHGQIIGENSDAPGFLKHLSRFNLLEIGRSLRCVILGAGGSARAVAYALAQAGHQGYVAARRQEQASRLVADLNRHLDNYTHLKSIGFDPEAIRQITPDVLINATSAGMLPHEHQSPWPENIPLPESCQVYDLIYNPPQTCLIQQARQEGLVATNGLGMLIEQAAISFEFWTGVCPPIASLYQAVGQTLPARTD